VKGTAEDDGGIAHGALLVRICDAMAADRPGAMREIEAEAISALGIDSFVDAVAVSALFHLMNRVANATGTPLDDTMIAPGEKVSEQIGANDFLSRHDTPSVDRESIGSGG
jgi:hypothetical protein